MKKCRFINEKIQNISQHKTRTHNQSLLAEQLFAHSTADRKIMIFKQAFDSGLSFENILSTEQML